MRNAKGKGSRFNPLAGVRLNTRHDVGDARNVAAILVDPGAAGLRDHWSKTSQALLTGAILHCCYAIRAEERRPATLGDVAELFAGREADVLRALGDMLAYGHVAGEPHPRVAREARSMLNKEDRERTSIWSTVAWHLTPYRDAADAGRVFLSRRGAGSSPSYSEPPPGRPRRGRFQEVRMAALCCAPSAQTVLLALAMGILWAVTLLGCAAAPPAPAISGAEERTVARDLVAALVEEWPPAWTTLEVVPGQSSAMLEELARRAGYAIAPRSAGTGVPVAAAIDRLGSLEVFTASLTAGPAWRVDRLYRRGRDGRLVPGSGYTIRAPRGELEALGSGTYSVVTTEDLEAPAEACARVAVRRGTLRANAARLVSACGYRVGRWPAAGGRLRDWVVEEDYAADVDGLRGVLDLIRRYGVAGRVRERDRTVDFEREER